MSTSSAPKIYVVISPCPQFVYLLAFFSCGHPYFLRHTRHRATISNMSIKSSSDLLNAPQVKGFEQPTPATSPLRTGSSIKVTKRDERGLLMYLLMLILRPISRFLLRPSRIQPPGSTRLKPPRSVRRKCTVNERQVDDIWLYDLTTRATHTSKEETDESKGPGGERRRIYYFNGGAYQMIPSSEHWSLALHMATHIPRTTVSVVSYPLAPNSPAPISFPMLVKLYHTLMREANEAGESVTFAGDSAGGNFAISVPLYALSNPIQPTPLPSPHERDSNPWDSVHPPPPPPADHHILAPKNILLICPSVDMRHINPHPESETARRDPMLSLKTLEHTARTYVGEWDLSDPRVSPLLADLEPLARFGVEVHGCTAGYVFLSASAFTNRSSY